MSQNRVSVCLIVMLWIVGLSEGSRTLSRVAQKQLIEGPNGDTIRCVNMTHQPAFDHPKLKNHVIQMRPSYHPKDLGMTKTSDSKRDIKPITQLWHLNGTCPEGTIPVVKNHKSFAKPMSAAPNSNTQPGHQQAVAYVEGGRYYGAKAEINVWKPQIQQPNGFSSSRIRIVGGSSSSNPDIIEAGWQVSPDLYGDDNPRLYIYSKSDDSEDTDCYNLDCPGFVQISEKIAPGFILSPISVYRSSQFEVNIMIWKDPKSGNWWLEVGDEIVGYWKAALFPHLVDNASRMEWGGEVVNLGSDGSHTTTQMGSGHFPSEGFSRAS